MSEKITLPGIVARLSERTGDTKRDSEDFIKELFAVIGAALEQGDSVRVRDLGIFKTIVVEPRKSVNVNTGETTVISGHRKVVFIPSKELASTVNEPFEMFQTVEISDDVAMNLEEEDASEQVNIAEAEPESVRESETEVESETVRESETETEPEIMRESEAEVEPETVRESETETERESEYVPEEEESEEDIFRIYQVDDEEPATQKEIPTETETREPELAENPDNVVALPQVKARFWSGFGTGFLAACLCGVIAWAVADFCYFHQVLNTKPRSNTAVIANTGAGGGEKPTIESKTPVTSVAEEMKKEESQESVASVTEADKKAEPGPEAVPTQPSDNKTYDTITKTRYLTTMAKDHYGNYHLWPYIYKENEKFLGHPDRIRPGTRVVVPPLSKYGVNPANPKDIEKAKRLGNAIYARYR